MLKWIAWVERCLLKNVDKIAHFGAYGMITLLLWRIFGQVELAATVTAVLAFVDEVIYQSRVEGRTSSAFDFLADFFGVLFVALILTGGN